MTEFKKFTNDSITSLRYQYSLLSDKLSERTTEATKLAQKLENLNGNLEFFVSKHDELQEQFEMLMDHLGLRIENGPRIVKDK